MYETETSSCLKNIAALPLKENIRFWNSNQTIYNTASNYIELLFVCWFKTGRWLAMLPALLDQGIMLKIKKKTFSALANNCWKVNKLIHLIFGRFLCHFCGSKHAGPFTFCCTLSLCCALPYSLLMTTAFPPPEVLLVKYCHSWSL